MARLIRAFDWSNSSLGAVDQWPISLKHSVHHCLLSTFPAAIYCGSDFTFIYNDAFIPIAGKKHPSDLLGLPCCETRREVWPMLLPIIHKVLMTGKTTKKENMLQLLDRVGFLEENYFTCSFNPIGLMEEKIIGVYEIVHYNTCQTIQKRRLITFKKLAEGLSHAKSTEEVYRLTAESLEINDAGIPFALLYSIDYNDNNANLEGVTRIKPGTDSSPFSISLQEPQKKGTWPLTQVILSSRSATVDLNSFPPLPFGRWQYPPKLANILPLVPEGERKPIGALIIGVSAVRAYDEDYNNFHKTIADYVAEALKKSRIFEQEIRRRKVLTELLEVKNNFFAKLGKELHTPITFIIQTLEDILSDTDSLLARQEERLILVRNSMACFKKMVDSLSDLSAFSQDEMNEQQPLYESLDVTEITTAITDMLRNSIARIRVTLPC